MKYFCLFSLTFLVSCAVTSIAPGEGADLELDLSAMDMRHGWVIATRPRRTVIGVNDLDSIKRGEALFKQHCAQCHGLDGSGNGEFAKKHNLKPANLKALARKMDNYYLVIQINNGKGNMPSWQEFLSAQQSWDLTNYIQTLNDK